MPAACSFVQFWDMKKRITSFLLIPFLPTPDDDGARVPDTRERDPRERACAPETRERAFPEPATREAPTFVTCRIGSDSDDPEASLEDLFESTPLKSSPI